MSSPVPASPGACLAAFGGRGEGRKQGGRDKPGGHAGLDAAGGGVFGGGVHEAEGGGGQPVLWQVGAEGSGAPAALDEGLHPAQDRVVNAADPLGGQDRRAYPLWRPLPRCDDSSASWPLESQRISAIKRADRRTYLASDPGVTAAHAQRP